MPWRLPNGLHTPWATGGLFGLLCLVADSFESFRHPLTVEEERRQRDKLRGDLGSKKPVLIKTDGYRCLAYQDYQGNWRTFYGGELISGKVEPLD